MGYFERFLLGQNMDSIFVGCVDRAVCQGVLYSEGMSAVVACLRRISSEKMNVGKAGMPNQQSIYYELIFSDKGVFS